jgi:hypothetical protein
MRTDLDAEVIRAKTPFWYRIIYYFFERERLISKGKIIFADFFWDFSFIENGQTVLAALVIS